MAKLAWIYKLSKNDLITEMHKHGLDTEGNAAILRKRLSSFVKSNEELFEEKPNDPMDFDEKQLIVDTAAQGSSLNAAELGQSNEEFFSVRQPTDYLEIIRKWGLHFNGKDLHSFLERIEDMQKAYNIPDNELIKGIPILLRDDAILWFRNECPEIESWAAFEHKLKQFFLSTSEQRDLERQIRECKQYSSEPIRTFITRLSTLIRRKNTYSPEEKMDTLYYGIKPDFRLHIPRGSVTSTEDLVHKVEDIEHTLKELSPKYYEQKPYSSGTPATSDKYDRNKNCWRCKEPGHTRFNCRNPAKLFCSRCGKNNIASKNCRCDPGNGRGAER